MHSPVNSRDVKLIGIHGPLDGGKDTVANYLQAKFPDTFARYAFAKPIKEACQVMFNFTQNQLEDRKLKEEVDSFWGFSPRKAMQLLGTEYGRNMLREDLWVKRAEAEITKNWSDGRGTIITDVRFENEAEWLRGQECALLIYLVAPHVNKSETRYQHASEAGISRADTDRVVINDKALGFKPLFEQLDKIFL